MDFDVVLAADVFIYVGDLALVFRDAARVLKAGGIFAFSVERADPARDFVLMPNGRYAQSEDYVRRLAGASGFDVLETLETTIRGKSCDAAIGQLFVLRKP